MPPRSSAHNAGIAPEAVFSLERERTPTMPREHYDRGPQAYAAADDLSPASLPQQEAYYLLRAQLTAAIARNWQAVLDSSPEIREAAKQLDAHVQRLPKRAFRAVRACDTDFTVDAKSRSLFLR